MPVRARLRSEARVLGLVALSLCLSLSPLPAFPVPLHSFLRVVRFEYSLIFWRRVCALVEQDCSTLLTPTERAALSEAEIFVARWPLEAAQVHCAGELETPGMLALAAEQKAPRLW